MRETHDLVVTSTCRLRWGMGAGMAIWPQSETPWEEMGHIWPGMAEEWT
jgi:hypothetical protein